MKDAKATSTSFSNKAVNSDNLYVYIYKHIYIYIYILYIYIYIYYICNHENNVPSQSYAPCAQVHELPQYHWGDKREGILFSWLHIYYTLIFFLWHLSTLCVVNHLWPLIYIIAKNHWPEFALYLRLLRRAKIFRC